MQIPIGMQSHATTGMSTATNIKAAEAGIDMVDTSISSMSMTYGHSATESVVAILQDTERDTGLDLNLLEEIASYFREVRKKYAKFEGALKGVDSRILVAQVPGGMLTNMENQLREQGASDRLDDVLKEIPRVREDLGFIPLVSVPAGEVNVIEVDAVLGGCPADFEVIEILVVIKKGVEPISGLGRVAVGIRQAPDHVDMVGSHCAKGHAQALVGGRDGRVRQKDQVLKRRPRIGEPVNVHIIGNVHCPGNK